jgi:hypothetical protein
MAKITAEQQAVHTQRWGIGRSDLPADGQLAHDRLVDQQARAETSPPPEPASGYVTMQRLVSAMRTAVSFPLAGSGIILMRFPQLITHFQAGTPLWPLAVRALGAALIVLGLRATIATSVRHADGTGTVARRSPPVHSHATA